MDIYAELGVRKIINGSSTRTALGGSLMPPEVIAAMAEAAQHFVRIDELQEKAGQKIAEWTHNEAAYVSCGAAAGLVLSTAVCIAGLDEAGRGAWAGPVAAGAVILPSTTGISAQLADVRDSKQMSPAARAFWAAEIKAVT